MNAQEMIAQEMDAQDELGGFRERFHLPKDVIYLCGHSLGLQPTSVRTYVEQELEDWEKLGVEGHFHARNPWMPYHRLATGKMAHVVGALPSEVVVMNSLTVNLHLMMVSFYRPIAPRSKILIEKGAFPSDQYAVRSQILYHGFDPKTSLMEVSGAEIVNAIESEGDSIALVLPGGVNYSTGEFYHLEAITRAGHDKGCVVGFDLAHAAGNVPLKLHDWGPDFAVWCTYKYLNSGPGSLGGCFVHERHARPGQIPRFAGWWGHEEESRFRMEPDFHPMPGAEGWQLSNPSILSLAAVRASLDLFEEARMDRLRAKSEALTGYLETLLHGRVDIVTPRDPARRGAQLSIRMPAGGRSICDRLAEKGVICDWREPDILRVAPVPLYNSFRDVFQFAQRFCAMLEVGSLRPVPLT
jgi:kynureninase